MATTKFVLDPRTPPELSHDQKAAVDALTDAQITAAAEADPDNPPLTDDEIDRLTAARIAKRARRNLSLTQRQFAERYRINYGRLRDIEQGRNTRPDTALIAYLTVIERDPEAVTRALTDGPPAS
jgi:putative transcriptional regulator